MLRRPTTSLTLCTVTPSSKISFARLNFCTGFRAGHPPDGCSEFGWHQDLPSQSSAETQRDDEGICHLGARRSVSPGAVGQRRLPAIHGGTISLPVGSSSGCLRWRISAPALTWHFAGLGEYPLEIAHKPIAGHRVLHQFDGKTLTILGKNMNIYTQVTIPRSIDHLVDELRESTTRRFRPPTC